MRSYSNDLERCGGDGSGGEAGCFADVRRKRDTRRASTTLIGYNHIS